MLKRLSCLIGFTFLCVTMVSFSLEAKVTEEEAARLGKELTPLGAEKAANAEGTIPKWTGGILKPPAGYKVGDHHPDPFAKDKILFTISSENVQKYANHLSPGQVAFLKRYPDYKINVYPSRRSASYPKYFYNATIANAIKTTLSKGGNNIENAITGIPFPIPQNGQEAIWNHLLRYRGESVEFFASQAAPTVSGKYTLINFRTIIDFLYSKPGARFEELNNKMLLYKYEIKAPARFTGEVLIVHETLNQVEEPRSAWKYNPGQRRVRRAPDVSRDNPGPNTDGLRTMDQFDMFNGATDHYNWNLIGKQELYVPYNSYKLHSDQLKYSDILKPGHIESKYARYELHRVWVVEATLKQDFRNIYPKRTFYIDEDTWSILVADQYDRRGKIWRVSEGHTINYYEVPTVWSTLEVHYDLVAGRYLANGLDNESKMYNFSVKINRSQFSPSALRRTGKR